MEKRSGSIIIDPNTGKAVAVEDPDYYKLYEDENGNVQQVPVNVITIKDK